MVWWCRGQALANRVRQCYLSRASRGNARQAIVRDDVDQDRRLGYRNASRISVASRRVTAAMKDRGLVRYLAQLRQALS